MKLAEIADLKIKNPQALNDAVMHRVPHAMMKERVKLEMQYLGVK